MFDFDLQRFAEAPAVDTTLGGMEPAPAETDPAPTTDPAPAANTAPETYDYSGALHEIFGDNAEMDDNVSTQLTDLLHGLGAAQDQAAAATLRHDLRP